MNRILKYILFFLSGLFLLILLFLLFTQTGVFRKVVKNQVLQAANKQLEGSVTFDRLEGNFFSNLTIHDFRAGLTQNDTLLSFDRLALSYSIWPLINRTIQVHSIELENPLFRMERGDDSTFTFLKLFPKRPGEEDSVPSKPLNMSFKLGRLIINNGFINFEMRNSVVPSFLSELNLEIGGTYGPKGLDANLKHLGFLTPKNIPDLEHLQVSVAREESIWSVRDFVLTTPRNQFEISGDYANLEKLDALFNTSPLQLDEFAWIVPDFKIGVTPTIDLTANVEKNDLHIELALAHQNESIDLKGHVQEFAQMIADSTRHRAVMDVTLSFSNLSPEKWFLLSDFPLLLNGQLKLSGNGLAGSNIPMDLNGDFSGSRWDQYQFSGLRVNASYMDGATKVRSRVATNMGIFNVDASANLKNTSAPFRLMVKAENFPAERFLPEWGDSTLLNMTMEADGSGNNAASLNADFSLLMENSVAARVPVDTLMLRGHFNKGDITLDTLHFLNSSARLFANGTYGENGRISSDFESHISNIKAFDPYVEVSARWHSLFVKGNASGSADSLIVDVMAAADSMSYDTLAHAAKIDVTGKGILTYRGFNGSADLNLSGIESFGQHADSLMLNARLTPEDWDARLSVWMADSVSLRTNVLGNMQAPFEFHLPELEIRTPFDNFSMEGEGTTIFMDTTRMELHDFYLTAHRNGLFHVRADGRYFPDDSIDVNFSVEQFDLSLLQKLTLLDVPLSGILSTRINASGPLSKPVFNMSAHLDGLAFQQLRVTKLAMDVNHKQDSLYTSLVMHSPLGDSITAHAVTPMFINLTDSQMVSTIQTVDGRLQATKLRPSAFFELENPDNQFLKGLVDADIKVGGNVMQPVFRGFVNMTNGEVAIPAYGIRYRDLKLRSRLDSNQVIIDSLFTRRDKGTFLIRGHVGFDTTLISGNVEDVDASLKARDFYLSRHRNHEIQINSDAWLKTRGENPVFGGELTVLRSSFYLPAILDMGGAGAADKPMLVKAIEEGGADESSIVAEEDTVKVGVDKPEKNMLKELTGNINIRLPRNSWVKSEDMNVELYGDFDLLKNNEYFEIFGTLGISRGYYTLYGRKLTIREGELTFQGGKEFNPRVNLRASYQFRGKDKQKNELIMIAGGTAFEPDLSFTLNGNSITERDAMAYLVFNQSFDQLSFSNQEGVSGNVPSAMLSGLVSSQLTKTIGNTFNLDMVEVKAGDDWESATFMVGKYITNNLFVTYQRGFGESDEESLTPQTITLEYEVTRNISFRLTQGDVKDSGIDLILKFEK